MRASRSTATILPVLFTAAGLSAADCRDNDRVATLFHRLAGDWQGEAVTTPVGPRPYDISFSRRAADWIYGQADPGAAIHHWGFYCENGGLWLRFLSTFRENRDPILLQATMISADEIHFEASDPAFLAVKVRPGSMHSEFEVLHHGERHVLIELERAKEK